MSDPTYADLFSSEVAYRRSEYNDDDEGAQSFTEYLENNISSTFRDDNNNIIYPEQ
jgi:hypothetical protein